MQNGRDEFPGLSSTLIFNSVEEFYRKFYFRPRKMFTSLAECCATRK